MSSWSAPLHSMSHAACAAWHHIFERLMVKNYQGIANTLDGRTQYCICPQRFRSGSPTNNRETDRYSHKKDRTIRLISVRGHEVHVGDVGGEITVLVVVGWCLDPPDKPNAFTFNAAHYAH